MPIAPKSYAVTYPKEILDVLSKAGTKQENFEDIKTVLKSLGTANNKKATDRMVLYIIKTTKAPSAARDLLYIMLSINITDLPSIDTGSVFVDMHNMIAMETGLKTYAGDVSDTEKFIFSSISQLTDSSALYAKVLNYIFQYLPVETSVLRKVCSEAIRRLEEENGLLDESGSEKEKENENENESEEDDDVFEGGGSDHARLRELLVVAKAIKEKRDKQMLYNLERINHKYLSLLHQMIPKTRENLNLFAPLLSLFQISPEVINLDLLSKVGFVALRPYRSAADDEVDRIERVYLDALRDGVDAHIFLIFFVEQIGLRINKSPTAVVEYLATEERFNRNSLTQVNVPAMGIKKFLYGLEENNTVITNSAALAPVIKKLLSKSPDAKDVERLLKHLVKITDRSQSMFNVIETAYKMVGSDGGSGSA